MQARADRQRIDHRGAEDRRAVEEDRGEHHGRDDRHRIGLEQVGGHAGAVADVVADVVGDGRRIARIVLGNAGFDLADEIGADVGALGEDAAAETGEDRDQRGAEAERDQRVDRRCGRRAVGRERGSGQEIDRDAEQREAGHQQAGDRARPEGDVEAGGEALVAACAVRTLARTETFMPMKPAAPDRIAPIRKPMATGPAKAGSRGR